MHGLNIVPLLLKHEKNYCIGLYSISHTSAQLYLEKAWFHRLGHHNLTLIHAPIIGNAHDVVVACRKLNTHCRV